MKQQLKQDMEQHTGARLGKEYIEAIYRHPACLTSMQNAWLDEAQAGIKRARRNINNLIYADNTTLMAENEEPSSLSTKVKEEMIKAGLKIRHSKN